MFGAYAHMTHWVRARRDLHPTHCSLLVATHVPPGVLCGGQ